MRSITEQSGQALQSGQADLVIGLVPWLESGFYQQVLFPQDWVCLVNPRHPRVGAKPLSLRDYKAEPHIGIVGGTGVQLLEAALLRHRVKRNVLLELPGFLGLAAIVSTTDLVATLPRQIGETLARTSALAVCDCPLPVPPFTVKQHWHARYHQDPANRWLRGVCASLFVTKKPLASVKEGHGQLAGHGLGVRPHAAPPCKGLASLFPLRDVQIGPVVLLIRDYPAGLESPLLALG